MREDAKNMQIHTELKLSDPLRKFTMCDSMKDTGKP